jgi:ATP-binding cassette subfamily B protein
MTWGGGFGGGAPGGFGRPAAPGLPFGGIPSELQGGVDRLLATEPEHPEPDIVFSQNGSEEEIRRLTLWR